MGSYRISFSKMKVIVIHLGAHLILILFGIFGALKIFSGLKITLSYIKEVGMLL